MAVSPILWLRLIVLCCMTAGVHDAVAQMAQVEWDASYGATALSATGSRNEWLRGVCRLNDGSYVAVGSSTYMYNFSTTAIYIVCVDAAGQALWERTLSGSGPCQAFHVVAHPNGGAVVLCQISSNVGEYTGWHGGNDLWVVYFDAEGNVVWQRAFGGSSEESPGNLTATNDGFLIAASTASIYGNVQNTDGQGQAWLISIDFDGNVSWQRCYGGSRADAATDVLVNSNGDYVVVGNTKSNDGNVVNPMPSTSLYPLSRIWIFSINTNGDLLWQNVFGSTSLNYYSRGIEATGDGYVMIGSKDMSDQGPLYVRIMGKVDLQGNMVWPTFHVFYQTDHDAATEVTVHPLTGEILMLSATGFNSGPDLGGHMNLRSLTNNGTTNWEFNVLCTACGSNMWSASFSTGMTSVQDNALVMVGNDIVLDNEGMPGNELQGRLVKVNFNAPLAVDEMVENNALFPNPASSKITLQNAPAGYWTVRNALGEMVMSGKHSGGTLQVALGDLPDGIYLWCFPNSTHRFIKVH